MLKNDEKLDRKIENLNNIVITYFKLKTLIEKDKKAKKLCIQRSIFYCLFIEIYKDYLLETSPRLGTKLGKFSGLHRTSFNNKVFYFKNELHLYDTRILNGDYSINHYHILLEKISGIDCSKMLIPKPILKKRKTSKK